MPEKSKNALRELENPKPKEADPKHVVANKAAKDRADAEAKVVAARQASGANLVRECKQCKKLVQTVEMNGPETCDEHEPVVEVVEEKPTTEPAPPSEPTNPGNLEG